MSAPAYGHIKGPFGRLKAPDLASKAIAPQPFKYVLVKNIAVNELSLLFGRHFERGKTRDGLAGQYDFVGRPPFFVGPIRVWNCWQAAQRSEFDIQTFDESKAFANVAYDDFDVPFGRVAFDWFKARDDASTFKVEQSMLCNFSGASSLPPKSNSRDNQEKIQSIKSQRVIGQPIITPGRIAALLGALCGPIFLWWVQ